MLVDFDDKTVQCVLDSLLIDKTTGLPIIYATEAYEGLWEREPITKDRVDQERWEIKPRVEKAKDVQKDRTKKKAEIFTPSWLCNRMNNIVDEVWFGKTDIFNIETESEEQVKKKTVKKHGWITSKEKVVFTPGKCWKDYVLDTRLEITCGEAPFVASRYDTATGEIIPVGDRIGLLDRKIRVISENTDSEKDWFEWAYKALQSVYGYEWQEDSLLIARISILMSFCEHATARWGKTPDKSQLEKAADIIAWNFWQMDGLTGLIPFGGADASAIKVEPICSGAKSGEVKAKIMDWQTGKPFEYLTLLEEKGA